MSDVATTRHATRFAGRIEIVPALRREEIEFLTAFAGPHSGPHRAPHDGLPARGRPLSWCQWVPTADGSALVWDGNAPFYLADRWLRYLIETFLSPRARLRRVLRGRRHTYPTALASFGFDHMLNGVVRAYDDDREVCRIRVCDNVVGVEAGLCRSATNRTRRPGVSCAAIGRSAGATTAITGYPPVTG